MAANFCNVISDAFYNVYINKVFAYSQHVFLSLMSTIQDMSTEFITSMAYTAREINRIYTSLDNFNIILWSDMELGERVHSCLGYFNLVEHAYAYKKNGKGNNCTGRLAGNVAMPRRLCDTKKDRELSTTEAHVAIAIYIGDAGLIEFIQHCK